MKSRPPPTQREREREREPHTPGRSCSCWLLASYPFTKDTPCSILPSSSLKDQKHPRASTWALSGGPISLSASSTSRSSSNLQYRRPPRDSEITPEQLSLSAYHTAIIPGAFFFIRELHTTESWLDRGTNYLLKRAALRIAILTT